MNVKMFENLKVGGVITLSDIQTQKEFGTMSADFRVKEIKTYREPNDIIHYTGYVCDYDSKDREEDQSIMLLVREADKDWDMFVYYLDSDGSAEEMAALIEQIDVDPEDAEEEVEEDEICLDEDVEILDDYDEDEEEVEEEDEIETDFDLVASFDATLHFEDAKLEATFDKKDLGSLFGVEYKSTEDKKGDMKTIAEYYTEDDTRGNPHAFLEWTGDEEKGWIEVWYGCEITKADIEVY